MKTLLLAFIALTLTTPLALAKDTKPLRVAMDVPYAPFGERGPDGKLVGFEVDLGNAMCQEITGQECDWVVQAWDGIIPGLLARKYDLIVSSMSITEERRNAVLFSEPYYTTPSLFFTRAESDFDQANTSDTRIGVQRGTNQERYVAEMHPDAKVIRYTTTDDMYLDLTGERLDAVFLDAPVGIKWGKDDPKVVQHGDFIKEPARIFGQGVGVAMRKRDKELAEKVNAALDKLKNNGVYDDIMNKYFDFDIKL
ncbi:transporter substrate-binding domain-containing protein [Marinobacter salinisoli]|uniref:Transporter substrate-binding domain-containing protein n=1 Tax=Marinobacter salinisoli TaxID=2769486 RepID=A0ABX7MS04_9GAMM|nr:transporter substrate-binding domain-containing protein [Marinobacter salinisoli]QSP95083.1 transporter substrate-binding domain-containing protein [Marinobacter salinisoli]